MTISGIVITLVYTGLIILARWNSFQELLRMPLNEFGDFFAGVFGPLMLFWLIIGYLQQQKELKQNTAALELQAEELRKSVEQHKELVKVTKEQVVAEVKSLELEELRSLREAHPVFSINYAGLKMKSGSNKKYRISLLNSGKPATDVFLTTVPEIQQVKAFSKIGFFNTGEKCNLDWDSEVSGEVPTKLMIVINCKDSNTRPYTKIFEMLLGEDETYHPITTSSAS